MKKPPDIYDLYFMGDEESRRRACPDCGPRIRNQERSKKQSSLKGVIRLKKKVKSHE